MKKPYLVLVIVLIISVQAGYSVTPQKWTLESFDDFIKGKFQGITISSGGKLTLSPVEEQLKSPPEEFFLSLAVTDENIVYIGTGHKGSVYRMTPNGEPELYFKAPEMDVTCLAYGPDGILYAGTSPNGKVYKITEKGDGTEFFNPHEKYIWDLMFTEQASLLAAVGEDGGIYEISPSGEGKKVFDSEENHILCMKRISDESFLAGSGGRGLLYRISKEKKASVLFESPYEEVRALAIDDEGNIFAGAGGVTGKNSKSQLPSTLSGSDEEVSVTVGSSESRARKISTSDGDQPSALYKINEGGKAKQVWKSDKDMIYSLCWEDSKQRMVFGTGRRGRLYTLDKEENISLLLQKDSQQVYLLFPFEENIYTLSNNPSQASVIHPEQRYNGEYTSKVYDAQLISSWGNIEWSGEVPSSTVIQLQTRSGNSKQPSSTWSDWSPPYKKENGEQILNPDARYLQFKILFKTNSGSVSPVVQKVMVFFLQHNRAPMIKKINILPPNTVLVEPPSGKEKIWGLESGAGEDQENKSFSGAKTVQRKGYRAVIWQVEDKNKDSLVYSIYIRNAEQEKWRILNENWKERIFTFDTLSLPEGEYFVKIKASDLPSNPQDNYLEHEKTSSSLVLDHSPPEISDMQPVRTGSRLKVQFRVQDKNSRIKKVRYFIRPLGWKVIFPKDGICDSYQEVFDFSIRLPEKFDDMITVKAEDEQGNVAVARASF
ncbi:MAG: hypothetical protein GF421_06230 [Candidatus Aminicenantes bacterium]|nr:hypothetical protein [Candidatus Aminicenantes bacterium]